MEQILEILTILANTYHYNYPPISKKIHVEILLQKILSCKYAKSSAEILSHLQEIKTFTSRTNHPNTNTPSIEDKKNPSLEKKPNRKKKTRTHKIKKILLYNLLL